MQQWANIQKDFNKVLKYSQGVDEEINTDKLFEQWSKAKEYFIQCFGGSLIKEIPDVTFTLGDKERDRRFNEFIDYIHYGIDNTSLSDFLSSQGAEGFFKNIVQEDYEISKDKIIRKGMKMSRAFKFFVHNDKTLAKIQTTMSMIIQEDKIKGTLCFSVHPLDYLSVSENNYNWRSCHSLDGEYRAGNLSYMVDSSTIVCYLKHDGENVYLAPFGNEVCWNNKKWRCLLYLSDNHDAWFAGRQYPFFANGALETIRAALLNLINQPNEEWSHWTDSKITEFNYKSSEGVENSVFIPKYICIRQELYKMSELVTDLDGSRQFNDLLYSSCYTPFYMFQHWSNVRKSHFSIGGPAICILCGENSIDYTDTMLCHDCITKYGYINELNEELFVCDRCGRTTHVNDGWWVDDDNYHVCHHCAMNECSECAACGELFFNEDIKFDEVEQKSYCKYCFDSIKEARELNGEGTNSQE